MLGLMTSLTSDLQTHYQVDLVMIKWQIIAAGDLCQGCGASRHFVDKCDRPKSQWLYDLEDLINGQDLVKGHNLKI